MFGQSYWYNKSRNMAEGGTTVARCVLIVNPTSGKEKALRYSPDLQLILAQRFNEVLFCPTQYAGHAEEIAYQAAMDGAQAVFCMGGDGTINETINGLARANKNTAFGFIPMGTVNDLARAMHIPLDPHHAIEMMRTAETVPLSIGRINDRYFVNIVAAGTLPEAVSQVSIEEKTRLGSLAYFIKAFKVLQHQQMHIFRIETETDIVIRRSPLFAAMLTNSVGSFRNLIPTKINDGKIRLAVFKDFELMDILKTAPELLTGVPINSEYVTVLDITKAKVTLLSGDPLSTNVDGDKGPDFPLEIEALPNFLQIYVPKKTEHTI